MSGRTGKPQEPAVVRVLRCTKTGRFYSWRGWTEEISGARIFPNQLSAVSACFENQLENVELLLLSESLEIFRVKIC